MRRCRVVTRRADKKISQDFEMIFYFLRPDCVLRAKRTPRAGKIKKRSKAEGIFSPASQATAGSDKLEHAERCPRSGRKISVIFQENHSTTQYE